jgi:alginate O-acetyltransferase complex protein AlgI
LFLAFVLATAALIPGQIGFFVTSLVFYLIFGNLTGLAVLVLLTLFLLYVRSGKFVIVVSLGVLILFKYSNLFLELVGSPLRFSGIFILGLSFFVFEIIHLAVERDKLTISLENKLHVMNFTFFWPTMVAGPIKRYNQFPEIEFFSKSKRDYTAGVLMIMSGYFLKYISDNISGWINIFQDIYFDSPHIRDKIIFLLALGFRIYWDFAGYSLIAIGLARFFGIQVPQNFNFPYIACSIISFWKRWHISLSTWIKDYVYIPLGGNRNHQYINLFIAMALCGFWHGASWNFLLWGAIHGAALIFCHLYMKYFNYSFSRYLLPLKFLSTQTFVFAAWLPFFYPLDRCLYFFKTVQV